MDNSTDDTDILKSNINIFLNINNEINILRTKIKGLNEQKKNYENNIISFMKNENISDINSANSKIKFNTSLRKETLNKRVMQQQITKYYENDQRFKNTNIANEVNKLINFIYKNRDKTVLNENLSIKNL
tara:strand:+ start:515 stop:904 length:390 start_codon:yes stop_codon:yes gene_type:complete